MGIITISLYLQLQTIIGILNPGQCGLSEQDQVVNSSGSVHDRCSLARQYDSAQRRQKTETH